jgi:predicted acylesterase/phospholipase RssA
LWESFDLVYGTSTGAIIAALLALGRSTQDIQRIYATHVPQIMGVRSSRTRSAALAALSSEVFEQATFEDVKTRLGIVATEWVRERPFIFKSVVAQAHGRKGTFRPGFGVTIAEAVQASCSAYPFFKRKIITTGDGDRVELVDGGFCANNPTLYAIADAVAGMHCTRDNLRIVSVGVGVYPEPKSLVRMARQCLPSVRLLQKTLEINTQSMDQLRLVLFKDVQTIRISDTFEQPEMATDFLEHDAKKLNLLRQRGADSFARVKADLERLLMKPPEREV